MDDYEPTSYWERRLRRNPNLAGVGYLPFGPAYNRWLYRAREEALERVLPDLRGRRLLDLGAGIGHFTRWAHDRGAEVAALDLTEAAVEMIRSSLPGVDARQGSVAEPLPEAWRGAFDVVLVLDVLYHVPGEQDFEQALRNAAAALGPGGVVAVTVIEPDERNLGASHVHHRRQDQYRRVLESEGLLWGEEVGVASRLNRGSPIASWVRRARLGWVVGAVRYALDRVRPGPPTLWLLTATRSA